MTIEIIYPEDLTTNAIAVINFYKKNYKMIAENRVEHDFIILQGNVIHANIQIGKRYGIYYKIIHIRGDIKCMIILN
jgi:hypothetical protein